MELNITLVGGVFAGLVAGYYVRQVIVARYTQSSEQKARDRVQHAEEEARILIDRAREQAQELSQEVKKDEIERKKKVESIELRLLDREKSLDSRFDELTQRQKNLDIELARIADVRREADGVKEKAALQLERVAGLSADDAKDQLFEMVRADYARDLSLSIQKLEKDRFDEIERRSVDIITVALQRYARGHVAEMTTSTFVLPDEDMKGKIIGREGRNIRAFERATGVELVMDESPDSIVISSFDPYRREVAKIALGKLVRDGRIQPAKIEEKVSEAQTELEKRTMELGQEAVFELGIVDFPPEIIKVIGQLHFRTSYGQNILTHSIEMAHIAGLMASELGLNVDVAKKAALVHDIGKAIDHEVEGTHIELGRKLLKKYGVDDLVIRSMESHHDDYPYSTSEAYLVTAADVLSGARPGARRDTVESYVKRLTDLEKIVSGFHGVKAAYAISGGREVRVFVIPEVVDDFGALQLAKDISGKIQTELKFPGEIKVNVIREMRAVEYAR